MVAPLIVGGAMLLSAVGSAWNSYKNGQITKQQLDLERQKLGLSEDEFNFYVQQTERQNAIQQHNTDLISPMLMQMLGMGMQNVQARPDYIRLQPPKINNPYQPGAGRFGNPAPPPITGLPWLNYGGAPSPTTQPAPMPTPAATPPTRPPAQPAGATPTAGARAPQQRGNEQQDARNATTAAQRALLQKLGILAPTTNMIGRLP